jgi:hypothetical protein
MERLFSAPHFFHRAWGKSGRAGLNCSRRSTQVFLTAIYAEDGRDLILWMAPFYGPTHPETQLQFPLKDRQ